MFSSWLDIGYFMYKKLFFCINIRKFVALLKCLREWKPYLVSCGHILGPVHMDVGNLGQVRSPRPGGATSLSIQSLFFLDRVYMFGGVPHQGGLAGQPVRITRFGGVSFLHVKAEEWGNPPNQGNQITRAWRVISTILPPKPPKH